MRVGLFSDVHGNAVALDAVLADLERVRVDRLVCLGDHVQGGAHPAECVERLRALGCPVVIGNADHFLLTRDLGAEGAESDERAAELLEVAEWSVAQLSAEQLDFIRSFRETVEVELAPDVRLLCFHGSPRSFDDIVLPETGVDEIRALVAARDAVLYAGGHVHLQWLRRVDDAQWLCVGSVGLAYDREQPDDDLRFDSWAEYAVVAYDGGRVGVEFRRVPFEADEYVHALLASGRPRADEAARQWQRA